MDFIIKLFAAAAFIAYLAVLGIYVPEWNLVAVLAIAGAMAVYDFFFYRPRAKPPRLTFRSGATSVPGDPSPIRSRR